MRDDRVVLRLEDALVDPEHLENGIFTASPDAILIVDPEGTILKASPATLRLFGYQPEELVGSGIEALIPPTSRDVHVEHLRQFMHSPRARQMGAGLELSGLHRDGSLFAVDISLVPISEGSLPRVAAFVRDTRVQRASMDRLRAVNEITQRLLNGAPMEDILHFFAESARVLSDAVASWVVAPNATGDLKVRAANGRNAESLVGVEISVDSGYSGGVIATGVPKVIPDFSEDGNVTELISDFNFGPGMYLPIISDDQCLGALVIARASGAPAFGAQDVASAGLFANAVAATITLGEERREIDRLRLIEEDERIARDLHDTVIQQLFAIGMSLQATRSEAMGLLGERIDLAVDRLDDVIRDIRNTIFRLPGHSEATLGLRAGMLSLADRFAGDLGFTPRIDFHGPVDIAVPEEIAGHLLQVLGEAFSNISRHAKARTAEAVVFVDRDWLTLVVSDDGIGIASRSPAGNGLRNMMARAHQLGGSLTVEGRSPVGTSIEWRVPI